MAQARKYEWEGMGNRSHFATLAIYCRAWQGLHVDGIFWSILY